MGLKDLLLNKGWAGTTFSRATTVERLNPILRSQHELNRLYHYAASHTPDAGADLAPLARAARMDAARLSETILSCGGASYNGTDLDPDDVDLGGDNLFERLRDAEEKHLERVREEEKENHQIRTRAVLANVGAHSEERLSAVRALAKAPRKTAPRQG